MIFNYAALRSVTMSGQHKYRRNPSACKIAEESACTTGDSACKLIQNVMLYIGWQRQYSFVTLLRQTVLVNFLPECNQQPFIVLGRGH